MRFLEGLLLLADLLALLAVAQRRTSAASWMRHAPVAAVLVLLAHWLAEGPRWQMVPAYALAAACGVLWCLRAGKLTAGPTREVLPHRMGRALAMGAAAVSLVVAIGLTIVAPVFHFPVPDGPQSIGTATYHWVDAGRPDSPATGAARRRQLMVQIWYPAQPDPSATPVAYMPQADAVTAAFAGIHGVPAFLFGHLKYVASHAMATPAVAADQTAYPVLLFLEGATGFRQMNTFQVEHLVSHGFVVVALDQPGAAAAVVFPDGHQAAGLPLAQLRDAVTPSYLPVGTDPAGKGADVASSGAPLDTGIVPDLAQDVRFALDQLAALNQADPHGRLTGRLDLRRIGAFGVSLGGIVVAESCRVDARLRACLMMDAPMPRDVVRSGFPQPAMWITRDAATMRLERQRAGGWPEAEISAHLDSMRAVYRGHTGAGYFVRVPGAFHSNFTDLAGWTPAARALGIAGPIDAQRAHNIVNAYTLAFFERHLLGRGNSLLDGQAAVFPDAVFEFRQP